MVKDILLFSCGVDSLSCWFYMNKPNMIYVDMQTKYSKKEIITIKKLERMIEGFRVKVINDINLGQFEVGGKAFVPYRNLVLACIAANYGDRVIIGGIEDDCVEDKNPEAFEAMTKCMQKISKPGKHIEVYSPFWKMSKSEIIKWMLNNVNNAEKYLRTSVSCYNENEGQCGNCPSCFRKAIAFSACDLNLDFYRNDVTKCELAKDYIEKMLSKNNPYTEKRTNETLKVLKKWGWKI